MEVKVIASSSSGNCALVETVGGVKILVDAGISFKRIESALHAWGVRVQELAAVLLTHEHSDHVCGINGFVELGVPVYATRGTRLALGGRLPWKEIPSRGKFGVGGVSIESFEIPHDAAEPVGYVIDDGRERLVWALDMGHLSGETKNILKSANILVIESNYCPHMLEADKKRPWSLKQRIKGRHGHLSNDDTFAFLTQETSSHWRRIVLAHLSAQCNDPLKLQRRYAPTGLPVEIVSPTSLIQKTPAHSAHKQRTEAQSELVFASTTVRGL